MTVQGNYGRPIDEPEEFYELPGEERRTLLAWILDAFTPRRTASRWTSYGAKHEFEDAPVGFYVTNGQFKGAMLAAGYDPVDHREQNWRFRCAKRAAV